MDGFILIKVYTWLECIHNWLSMKSLIMKEMNYLEKID